jgi:hypothetical protein
VKYESKVSASSNMQMKLRYTVLAKNRHKTHHYEKAAD